MKKSIFIKFVFICFLGVALVAPFTFMKVIKPQIEVPIEKEDVAIAKPKVIEKPLHTVNLPDFGNIRDVKEKKKQFFNFLRPVINSENDKILRSRKNITAWIEKVSLEEELTEVDQAQLLALILRYKINHNDTVLQQLNKLLNKVDIVPTSLVLVQAANESAWGTSRFARIGLNFFGIWCFRPTCGMVPSSRNSHAKHEVAAFKSVDQAVNRYLYNINTNNAYVVFRAIRAELRAQNHELQPEVLATGLLPYSERGTDYVLEITEMIRHNQEYFDNPKVSE